MLGVMSRFLWEAWEEMTFCSVTYPCIGSSLLVRKLGSLMCTKARTAIVLHMDE